MGVDVRRLRYFVTLAEERNFRRAAARLHIAQPSLSQQIASLERELGVLLFDRTVQPVALTRAAEELLPRATRVLADLDAAVDATRAAARHDAATLRVGFMGSAGRGVIPEALRRLRDDQPALQVDLVEVPLGATADAVRGHHVDVCFTRRREEGPGLVCAGLPPDDLVVAVPAGHPLADAGPLSLGALAGETFVRPASTGELQLWADFVLDLCRTAGFSPTWASQEGSTHQAIAGLVASGAGIAVLSATSHALPREGVVAVPLCDASMSLFLLHRTDDERGVVTTFVREASCVGGSRHVTRRP